jgi:hypothetical protein
MKTIRSLRFHAGGRWRRLKRFTPAGNLYVRVKVHGREVWKSLGTKDERVALQMAPGEVEKMIAIGTGALPPNDKRKYCTLGEIAAAYQPDPRYVSPESAQKNRSALLLIAREGLGLGDGTAGASDPARNVSSQYLTAQLKRDWKRKRLAAMRGVDLKAQESAVRTINSTLRQASSLFKQEYMDLYAGLRLPDLASWRGEGGEKENDRSGCLFEPFTADIISGIEGKLAAWRVAALAGDEAARNLFCAVFLMSHFGMRNKEVEHTRGEWFEEMTDGRLKIVIKLRPYFKVKNSSVRFLVLPAVEAAQLRPFLPAPCDWLISAHTKTRRYEATHDAVNAELRPIIPSREKCSYELRKHAGSIVWTLSGAEAAAAFLGDTIQTVQRYYGRNLRPVLAPSAVQLREQFAA